MTTPYRIDDLAGRTVVVTGGTGGIGQHLVSACAQCGANVAVLSRTSERVAEVVGSGLDAAVRGRVLAVGADVTDRPALEHARAAVLDRFGRVDALVNAAGGNRPSASAAGDLSFFDLPDAALRGVVDLNLIGTILPSQVFGRLMADAGNGRDPERDVDERRSRPLTRMTAYVGRQGRRQQLHAVARGPHGAGVLAAHSRERGRARLLPDARRTSSC